MKDTHRHSSHRSSDQHGDNGEFSAAINRLEKAVQEIVTVTKGQLSDRATSLIDDTTQRIESELRLRRVSADPEVEEKQARRRRRRRKRHRLVDRAERVNPRSGRLYRDVEKQKIAGVCAGLARYFGLQTWAVRLGALSGLLFLPGIVFPAYWIMYFIMDVPTELTDERGSEDSGHRSKSRYKKKASSAGERPQPFAASRELKYANADLTEAELRLRRIESYVTSDRYELQKEIAKIEREGQPSV